MDSEGCCPTEDVSLTGEYFFQVLSSSEKLKPKGSRSGGDFGTLPKVGQQSVPQLVNHTLRGSNRPDISKPSQVGNFQVLNRERSGVSPTARDCPSATNISGALNPLGLVSAAATVPPLKTPNNLKLRVDGKATSLPVTTVAEKRPLTQQNRSEFFNSLRKKTSSSNATSIPGPTSYQLSTLEKSDEQTTGLSTSLDTEMKDTSSNSALDCSVGKSNGARSLDACKDSEDSPPCDGEKSCLDPAEEERLLRLFGWKENVGEEEEALTAEEIDAFLEEYQKLRPSSKFSRRNLLLANAALLETGDDGSGSGPTLSDSKSEGF
ncbi:hypothetical protein Taro_022211 [Colocasia esculenta]|uniref:Uncharacterized protein n=1 Tax=Colocasia esculenta TaxID=4460 RepID=A0A843VAN2_COLES|nr:hypothetical protein [Colocasia esculenta]